MSLIVSYLGDGVYLESFTKVRNIGYIPDMFKLA